MNTIVTSRVQGKTIDKLGITSIRKDQISRHPDTNPAEIRTLIQTDYGIDITYYR